MIKFICEKTRSRCRLCRQGPCPNRIIVEDDPNDGKFTGLLEEDIS